MMMPVHIRKMNKIDQNLYKRTPGTVTFKTYTPAWITCGHTWATFHFMLHPHSSYHDNKLHRMAGNKHNVQLLCYKP